MTSPNKTLGAESPRSTLAAKLHACHSLAMEKCDPTPRGRLEACAWFPLDVAARASS